MRLTGSLLCVSLSWKSGTWAYAKRCVSAKSVMSKLKRRKVRSYRSSDLTIRGQVSVCLSWVKPFLAISPFRALKTAAFVHTPTLWKSCMPGPHFSLLHIEFAFCFPTIICSSQFHRKRRRCLTFRISYGLVSLTQSLFCRQSAHGLDIVAR